MRKSTPDPPSAGALPADPQKKDRKYALMLYPDADNYNLDDVLSRARQFAEWSYILHDRDVDDDKMPQKPHVHLVVRLLSPHPPSTVSNKLLLPPEVLVYRIARYNNYLQYIMHRTEDSRLKYQYPLSELHTNIHNIMDIVIGNDETCAMRTIVSLIDDNPQLTISALTRRILSDYPDLWASYRRNYSIIKHLLFEACYVDDVWASLTGKRISEGIVSINAIELNNLLKSLRSGKK